MHEIATSYEASTGQHIDLTISSSGKLTAQILAGAPYDVFISADERYPQEIYSAGKATSPPQIYAYGKIALWSHRSDLDVSIDELSNDDIKHIAIANPKIAPYGQAAMSALTNNGTQKSIEHKLVYGESISQVNQFVVTKAVDVGITAQSTMNTDAARGIGRYALIDTALYDPIAQAAVLISQDDERRALKAKMLYDFIYSAEGREIIARYGYDLP